MSRQSVHQAEALLSMAEERMENAQWCKAEAVYTDDDERRDMLTRIAEGDLRQAAAHIKEAADTLEGS